MGLVRVFTKCRGCTDSRLKDFRFLALTPSIAPTPSKFALFLCVWSGAKDGRPQDDRHVLRDGLGGKRKTPLILSLPPVFICVKATVGVW